MTATKIECNGINMARLESPIIAKDEYKSFDGDIDRARRVFLAEHQSEFGHRLLDDQRFYANNVVLDRIVSACPSREEFDQFKTEWINAGLEDCARSDYWYTHEKDWGN